MSLTEKSWKANQIILFLHVIDCHCVYTFFSCTFISPIRDFDFCDFDFSGVTVSASSPSGVSPTQVNCFSFLEKIRSRKLLTDGAFYNELGRERWRNKVSASPRESHGSEKRVSCQMSSSRSMFHSYCTYNIPVKQRRPVFIATQLIWCFFMKEQINGMKTLH